MLKELFHEFSDENASNIFFFEPTFIYIVQLAAFLKLNFTGFSAIKNSEFVFSTSKLLEINGSLYNIVLPFKFISPSIFDF